MPRTAPVTAAVVARRRTHACSSTLKPTSASTATHAEPRGVSLGRLLAPHEVRGSASGTQTRPDHNCRDSDVEVNNADRTHVWVSRIYDTPNPTGGVRVLVDRLWPRGISKDKAALDEWC